MDPAPMIAFVPDWEYEVWIWRPWSHAWVRHRAERSKQKEKRVKNQVRVKRRNSPSIKPFGEFLGAA